MITLRPYQSEVIEKLWAWFRNNTEGNPIVNACVGAGKSIMIAELCRIVAHGFDTRGRVLVVVPSKELAEQNYEKLVSIGSGLRIGLMSAALGKKDFVHDKDVVLGTVGTLANRGDRLGFYDLVLIDECHLVSRTDSGMYRDLITALKRNNAQLRVIGWTGTPFRGNGIWLHAGDTRLFTDIATSVTIKQLLKLGFLSTLVVSETQTHIDATGVQIRNNDYVSSQLAERLDRDDINARIADEIVTLGAARKKWLVFCCTIEHAEHMCAALTLRGASCAVISAKTPKAERAKIMADLRAGRIRGVCNVATMTTGVDIPDLDLIALIRNTLSPVLYTQIMGRGMRIHPDKDDCMVLDFTDTVASMGPVDLITGRNPKLSVTCGACGHVNSGDAKVCKKCGEPLYAAPHKLCDKCGSSNPASATTCIECDEPFPEIVRKINETASNVPVISGGTRLEVFDVDFVSYGRKTSKQTGVPYLQVSFHCGFDIFHINLFIEHSGYARNKALTTLYAISLTTIPHETVDGAVNGLNSYGLKEFESITVNILSKWKDVVSWKLK
jgi:DNA repair protein RadD